MRKFIRTFSDHKTKATAVALSTGKVDVYWNTPDLNPALMDEYSAWRTEILSKLQAPPASRYCAVVDGEGNLVAEIGLTHKPADPLS